MFIQAMEKELLDHLSQDFIREGYLYKTGPSPKVLLGLIINNTSMGHNTLYDDNIQLYYLQKINLIIV